MTDCEIIWSKSAQATIVPSLNREPLDWAQNEVAVEPEPVIEKHEKAVTNDPS